MKVFRIYRCHPVLIALTYSMEQDKKYVENYKDDHVLFPVAAIDSTSNPPAPATSLPLVLVLVISLFSTVDALKYQISLYSRGLQGDVVYFG